MLAEASNLCSDVSVIRRLSFAAINIHKDTPNYWEIVTKFGFRTSSSSVSPCSEKVKVFMENVEYLDGHAFDHDSDMLRELLQQEGFQGHLLGIVLISSNSTCGACGGQLLLRADRPSFPIIYSDKLGTVCGTHFRKYCKNNHTGCSFTQHYGYHMNGSNSEMVYDHDCLDLPFFLSSNSTGFETKMLCNLTAEILLSQMAYRQRAEIYNYVHGYDFTLKKSATSRCPIVADKDSCG